jgi:hypothetical protein
MFSGQWLLATNLSDESVKPVSLVFDGNQKPQYTTKHQGKRIAGIVEHLYPRSHHFGRSKLSLSGPSAFDKWNHVADPTAIGSLANLA